MLTIWSCHVLSSRSGRQSPMGDVGYNFIYIYYKCFYTKRNKFQIIIAIFKFKILVNTRQTFETHALTPEIT
jgi:hypothetical protein